MAQLGGAPALGAGGRGFKSRCPDTIKTENVVLTPCEYKLKLRGDTIVNLTDELIEQAEKMVVPIVDDDGEDYNACLLRMSHEIKDDLRLQFPVNWHIDSRNIPNAISVMPSAGVLVEYTCSYITIGDLTQIYIKKDELSEDFGSEAVTLQEVLLPSSDSTSYAIVVKTDNMTKVICYEACGGLGYYLRVDIMSIRNDVSVESMIGNFVFDFGRPGGEAND